MHINEIAQKMITKTLSKQYLDLLLEKPSRRTVFPENQSNLLIEIIKLTKTQNQFRISFRLKAMHDYGSGFRIKMENEIAWKRLLMEMRLFKIIEKGPLTLTCSATNCFDHL